MKPRYRLRALTFEYHGIAGRELDSARRIAGEAGVLEHRVVRLPDLKEASDIPNVRFEGLPPTYIPLRNSIFYSLAASYAEETGAAAVVGGHNGDDAKVFEDVGPQFFSTLQKALLLGSARLRRNRFRILRPLKDRNKIDVLRLGGSLGVPMELTWSCHRDGRTHCWHCPGCNSRRLAFSGAGMEDPALGAVEKIT